MIGQVFHRLTVVAEGEIRLGRKGKPLTVSEYQCRCECGTLVIKRKSDLIRGQAKSCGCINKAAPKEHMIGKQFGELTIVTEVEPIRCPKGHVRFRQFKVRCSCGNEKALRESHLTTGNIKSCGCKRFERFVGAKDKNEELRLQAEERRRQREIVRQNRPTKTERYWSDPAYRAKKLEDQRVWTKNNMGKALAKKAKRRAVKLCATPKWLTSLQLKEIQEIYKEAQRMKAETGIIYHVDHIIPLQGEDVCGLHVPWNLQILTAVENLRKSNRLVDAA